MRSAPYGYQDVQSVFFADVLINISPTVTQPLMLGFDSSGHQHLTEGLVSEHNLVKALWYATSKADDL